MTWTDGLVAIARAVEIAGVAVMVLGFVLAGILAGSELRRDPDRDVVRPTRQRVGRAILLGLELLVAADIIRTVVEIPTLDRLAVLAAIVAIRTFLSFTLEIELTGELPWRRSAAGAADATPTTTTRGADHGFSNENDGSRRDPPLGGSPRWDPDRGQRH